MSQIYETPQQEVVQEKTSSGILSFAKVFLYMFMFLAISAAVAFGIPYILVIAARNGATIDVIANTYYGLMIASGISLFILMIIINFVFLRGKHSVIVPAIIYAVMMGVLLSSFVILLSDGMWWILGMAFGITAGIFLLMTLIAVLTKGNLHPLLMVGIGLLIGAGVLSLVNWLIGSDTIMWIVTFAMFAAIMFITMFDIWNIKKICERGQMNNNLSLYCAFTLFVDFIYILIRVLIFLIIIFAKNR